MQKILLFIISLFITTSTFAKNNNFGFYGFIDEMPYAVGQCFNNITKINGKIDEYKIKITFDKVSAIGKTKISKPRCGVFVFNDGIVGAMENYFGEKSKFTWFIKPDGIHIYGESGTYTGAMQFALSKLKHKKVFYLHEIQGSFDDDVNLYATIAIRQQGYNTVLPNGGKIYSGGVDFFLAGKKRAIENENFEFGVHSWDGSSGEGRELPKDHPEHQMFLETMRELDITTDFYWYTLEVAPASGMHLMNLDEIKKFKIVNSTYKNATK